MTELVASLRGAVGGIPARLRQPDRVWLAILLLFAGLAVFDQSRGDQTASQALASLRFTADAFLWIAPFLALSVGLAAWLKAAGADQLISRAVARRPLPAILIAAGFGALSPFCSCGVVPLVAALLAAGMPLPAVMAFWISSPLMDPESFVLMAATIGIGFTVAKTVAAIAMGLIGGLATWGLMSLGLGKDPLKATVGCGSSCGGGLSDAGVRWRFWDDPARRRAFVDEARAVGLFLAKWLLLAFAIESLMVAWLPPDLIARTLGGDGWQAVPAGGAGRRAGLPERLRGHPPDRRAARHGHGAGRGHGLPDRRRGDLDPGRHGGLRPGQAQGLRLVSGAGAAWIAGHGHRLSDLRHGLALTAGGGPAPGWVVNPPRR